MRCRLRTTKRRLWHILSKHDPEDGVMLEFAFRSSCQHSGPRNEALYCCLECNLRVRG